MSEFYFLTVWRTVLCFSLRFSQCGTTALLTSNSFFFSTLYLAFKTDTCREEKRQHVCQSLTEKPMWISLNKGRQWSGYKGRNSKEMEKKMLRKGLCTKINLLWGSKALMIKSRADELRGKNSGLWEYAKVKRLEIRQVSFKFLQILEIFA